MRWYIGKYITGFFRYIDTKQTDECKKSEMQSDIRKGSPGVTYQQSTVVELEKKIVFEPGMKNSIYGHTVAVMMNWLEWNQVNVKETD